MSTFWLPETDPRPVTAVRLAEWEAELGFELPSAVRELFGVSSGGKVLRNAIRVGVQHVDPFFPTGPAHPDQRAWTTVGSYIDGNNLDRSPGAERGWDLDRLVFLKFPAHWAGVLLDYSAPDEPGVIIVQTDHNDPLTLTEVARFENWKDFTEALVSFREEDTVAVAVYVGASAATLEAWIEDNAQQLEEWPELDEARFTCVSNVRAKDSPWFAQYGANDAILIVEGDIDFYGSVATISEFFQGIADDLGATCDVVETGSIGVYEDPEDTTVSRGQVGQATSLDTDDPATERISPDSPDSDRLPAIQLNPAGDVRFPLSAIPFNVGKAESIAAWKSALAGNDRLVLIHDDLDVAVLARIVRGIKVPGGIMGIIAGEGRVAISERAVDDHGVLRVHAVPLPAGSPGPFLQELIERVLSQVDLIPEFRQLFGLEMAPDAIVDLACSIAPGATREEKLEMLAELDLGRRASLAARFFS